jgi:hypothetical protein
MISGGSHKRFIYWHPPEKMCNSRQENTTIEYRIKGDLTWKKEGAIWKEY